MAGKSESSIHFAVQSCLARCRLSDAPLTSLRDFADELSAAGWDQEAVEQVNRHVLDALPRTDTLGRQSIVVTPHWQPDSTHLKN